MTFYIKYITFAFTIMIFCSCGTGLKTGKSGFEPISHDYSGAFNNIPYLTTGKSYLSKEAFPPLTILNHFDTTHIRTKTVLVTFNSKIQLVITYKDSLTTGSATFDGKFSKKGYYEIFFSKKKIEIPPIIPIFWSHRDINRLRIALTKSNDLVIDRKRVLDGNFFFIGGGAHDRTQSFFHPLMKVE
jgi:hypothetical protein